MEQERTFELGTQYSSPYATVKDDRIISIARNFSVINDIDYSSIIVANNKNSIILNNKDTKISGIGVYSPGFLHYGTIENAEFGPGDLKDFDAFLILVDSQAQLIKSFGANGIISFDHNGLVEEIANFTTHKEGLHIIYAASESAFNSEMFAININPWTMDSPQVQPTSLGISGDFYVGDVLVRDDDIFIGLTVFEEGRNFGNFLKEHPNETKILHFTRSNDESEINYLLEDSLVLQKSKLRFAIDRLLPVDSQSFLVSTSYQRKGSWYRNILKVKSNLVADATFGHDGYLFAEDVTDRLDYVLFKSNLYILRISEGNILEVEILNLSSTSFGDSTQENLRFHLDGEYYRGALITHNGSKLHYFTGGSLKLTLNTIDLLTGLTEVVDL